MLRSGENCKAKNGQKASEFEGLSLAAAKNEHGPNLTPKSCVPGWGDLWDTETGDSSHRRFTGGGASETPCKANEKKQGGFPVHVHGTEAPTRFHAEQLLWTPRQHI